jgi:hypothetical protein
LETALGIINRTSVLGITLLSCTTEDDSDEDGFEQPIDGGDTGVYTMTVYADLMFVEAAINP